MSTNQNKYQKNSYFMKLAFQQASRVLGNTRENPAVGCVIVKNNKIIAEGNNQVTNLNDPTAHAEIVAIRNACKSINDFNLKGTEIYTSCEPCPMCLSAIYWSHIDKIYYGNTRLEAANIGFDDNHIYEELNKELSTRLIHMEQINKNDAIKAFEKWELKVDKKEY